MTVKQFINRDKSKQLVWNDPLPIKNNNYNITWIEPFNEEDLNDDYVLLIQYNEGLSEAEVLISEINYKK